MQLKLSNNEKIVYDLLEKYKKPLKCNRGPGGERPFKRRLVSSPTIPTALVYEAANAGDINLVMLQRPWE